MADGRHLEKSKNRHILAAVQSIFTKFGTLVQFEPLTVLAVKNFKFWKFKMAAAAILKNLKIAISRPRYDRFWQNLARWRSSALVTVWSVTNLRSKEIEDGSGRHPNNRKITISRQRLKDLTDLHSIWHIMTHIGPPNQACYSRTFVRQFLCVNFAYANF